MFCAIAQNAFFLLYYSDERFSARGEHVEGVSKLPPHAATHVVTRKFQAELISKLLITGTDVRKQAVATLLSSPASMLHPQDTYAIAFSAGLNGFQVH